jgi:hypothetical protein
MKGFQATQQKKPPALQRDYPALQNLEFLHFFCGYLLADYIRILNPESKDPIESGFNPHLNPDH